MQLLIFKDWIKDVFIPSVLSHRWLIITALLLVFIFHQDTMIEEQDDEINRVVQDYKDLRYTEEKRYNDMLLYYKNKELDILAKELQEMKDKDVRVKEQQD